MIIRSQHCAGRAARVRLPPWVLGGLVVCRPIGHRTLTKASLEQVGGAPYASIALDPATLPGNPRKKVVPCLDRGCLAMA